MKNENYSAGGIFNEKFYERKSGGKK